MNNKFASILFLSTLLFISCKNSRPKEVKGVVLEKHFTDSILKSTDSLMIKSIENVSVTTISYR